MIRQRRSQEVEFALLQHLDENDGGAYFVTFTLRHRKGDALVMLLAVLLGAFRAMCAGRGGQAFRSAFGVVGMVRALEITFGANGWHPHLHVIFLTRGRTNEVTAAKLAFWLTERWYGAVTKRLKVAAPAEGIGVQVEAVTGRGGALARYVAKLQEGSHAAPASMELTRFDLKVARRGREGGSFTPFDLLVEYDVARANGRHKDAAYLAALWREYEAATAGKSAIHWSRGLAERLGVFITSDARAVEDYATHGEIVATLNLWEWKAICRFGLREELLKVAEAGDTMDLLLFIAEALELDRAASVPPDDPLEEVA